MKPGTVLISIFLFFPALLSSQNLSGHIFVCPENCYEYTIDRDVVNSIAEIQVVTPLGDTIYVEVDDTTVEICFDEYGPYTLQPVSQDGLVGPALEVFGGEFTEAELKISRPVSCKDQSQTGQGCIEVCEGETITLEIDQLDPSEIEWYFSGNGEIISYTEKTITIYLEEGAGQAWVSFTGMVGENCNVEGNTCILVTAPPTAGFVTSPGAVNDTVEICRGQTVQFESTSEGGPVNWYGGELGASTGNTFSLRFEESGTFSVLQTVGEICNCLDSSEVVVKVLDGDAAPIYCQSSVCLGDTVLYKTDPDCGPYQWGFSGEGTLIAGGTESDDFIQINWTHGTEGQVSLSSACSGQCPFPTVEPVYILGPETAISGPDIVCSGRSYTYSLPPFDGTNFQWSVSQGQILSGQGSNRIQVHFPPSSGMAHISVEADDCTRNCNTRDTFWVEILDPFYIEGPNILCPDEAGTWETLSEGEAVLSSFEIFNAQGELIDEISNLSATLDYIQNTPGQYTILASPVNESFCNSFATTQFTVTEQPPDIDHIAGETEICPGLSYSYGIDTTFSPVIYLDWMVIQEGDTSSFTGSSLDVTWGSAPDKKIQLRAVNSLSGCPGKWTEMEIQNKPDFSVSGPSEVCLFDTSGYTADLGGYDHLTWTIDPPIGFVQERSDDQSVLVKWQESGTATFRAEACGVFSEFEVTVRPNPEPEILAGQVCEPGTTDVTTSISFKSYEWYKGEYLICTENICSLGSGEYLLLVEDSLGCPGKERFEIQGQHPLAINIVNHDPAGFCTGDSVRLSGNVSTAQGYELNWYQDGNLVASDVDTFFATEFGDYSLEAIHSASSCVSLSNVIELCEFCDPVLILEECPAITVPGRRPGTCNPGDGKIDVSFSVDGECNNFVFTSSGPGLIDDMLEWRIMGGSNFYLYGNSVEYTFESPGEHRMVVNGFGINADGDTVKLVRNIFTVEVYNFTELEDKAICHGDTLHFDPDIQLTSGVDILSFEWDFGDPASGTSNLSSRQSPHHIYSDTGNFTVNLTIETDANCHLNAEATISVRPVPDPTFEIPPPVCKDQPVFLEATSENHFYEWHFSNDTVPGDTRNPTAFLFENTGAHPIKLKVENLWGCSAYSRDTVEVHEFSAVVEIDADRDPPICKGDTVMLSGTMGNFFYNWNTGDTTPTLPVTEGGSYSLEFTDSSGCTQTAGPLVVNFVPPPEAQVAGRLVNSGGWIVNDTLIACQGEPIQLRASGQQADRAFVWNDSSTSQNLFLDGIENDFPEPGVHRFTVEVENTITGCRNQSPGFYVKIHELPPQPLLSIQPEDGPYCHGDDILISATNTEAGINYFWNTGQAGPTLQTSAAGVYQLTAVNDLGCKSKSEAVTVHPQPNLSFAPRGCYEYCEQAEICFPLPPHYNLIEWEVNGESGDMPADLSQIEITESSEITALVASEHGCITRTPPINIDILEGSGTLNGIVFLDLDGDSIYTAADSLLPGVTVYLLSEGEILDSATTDQDGQYSFDDIAVGYYEISVFPDNLPDEWIRIGTDNGAEIAYCGHRAQANPLIFRFCAMEADTFFHHLCPGDSLIIDGNVFTKDSIFSLSFSDGPCPENEIHIISFFDPVDTLREDFTSCEGQPIDWNSIQIHSDTTITEVVQDTNGCNFTRVTDFTLVPPAEKDITISLCPGEEVYFNGILIDRDTVFTHHMESQTSGCDTIFQVKAERMPDWEISTHTDKTCPGQADGTVQIELIGIETGKVLNFSINDQPTDFRETVGELESGEHKLVVTDQNDCSKEHLFEIEAYANLHAEIAPIEMDCESTEGRLEVNLINGHDQLEVIEWDEGTTGGELEVNRPGIYHVDIVGKCYILRMTGEVIFTDEAGELEVYVPNAFSPNDDGVNDYFLPYFPPEAEIRDLDFSVFDRWGNRVFKSNHKLNGWDGTFSDGERSDVTVFVWVLKAEIEHCGQVKFVKKHGDVTVIR